MSAETQKSGGALGEDLELTDDAAARVKGGKYPIEPGDDMITRLPRFIVRKKKKAAKRHYPGGGRPV